MIDNILGYNNVVKNRRLLLERSAKEIARYAAGKASFEKSIPMLSANSALGIELQGNDVIKNTLVNIDSPRTIEQIIKSLSRVVDPNIYSDVFVIYDKDEVNKIKNPNMKTKTKDEQDNDIFVYDIKSYLGESFVQPNTFNKPDMKSSRIVNPRFAVIKVKNHNAGFGDSKESNYLPLVSSVIPNVEMSRCVPHLNISILDDDKNEENLLSLGKFLVGRRAFKNDGFAKGLTKSRLYEKNDSTIDKISSVFASRSGQQTPQKVAGMELFQSPQSLVNADINKFQSGDERVVDPFRPLMAIENFNISDNLLGLEFLSTTQGTLSLKLFDRSRMPEVSKLVGQDYLASVFLIIEFGWSHPDGSIISNNPYGQFLDSLKRREIYVVNNSKITVNDDGSASINLTIASLGSDNWKKSCQSQKYITTKEFIKVLRLIKKKLKLAQNNQEALKTTIKDKETIGFNLNQFNSYDLINRSSLEEINFFDRVQEIINWEPGSVVTLVSIEELVGSLVEDLNTALSEEDAPIPFHSEKSLEEFQKEAQDILDLEKPESLEEAADDLIAGGGLPLTAIITSLGKDSNYTTSDIMSVLGSKGYSDESLQQAGKLLGIKNDIIDKRIEDKKIKAIESSADVFLKDMIDFITRPDPMINLTVETNSGASASDVQNTSISNNENKNDTTEIFARLASVGVDIGETIRSSLDYDTSFEIAKDDDSTSEAVNLVTTNKYITLGKLLSYYYGLPDVQQRTHDEVQMYFHPANQQAACFSNITLADVFISTERYLNAVKSKLAAKMSSDLTIKEHFAIVKNILASDNYEVGYGIQTLSTIEEDGKNLPKKEREELDKKIEEHIKEQNQKLSKIYEDSSVAESKTLSFKKINLKVKFESLPYVENGVVKKMKRIHIFDDNTEYYKDQQQLLSALNTTSLMTVVNGNVFGATRFINDNNNILRKFTRLLFPGYSPNEKFSSITKNIASKLLPFQKVDAKIAREIDSILKSSMPTIELGAENGFIQSMSLNNDNGGLANEANMLDYVTSLGNAQNPERATSKFKTFLNPGSLNITMLGFPIVEIGQTFYVTGKTNTTLDNVYTVKSVSHSVAEGNFITNLTLESTNRATNMDVNITKALIELGLVSKSSTLNPKAEIYKNL